MVLAGLWEFPGWQVDSAAVSDSSLLRQAVDDSLPELIGTSSMSPLGSLHIVRRLRLGAVLHTFSHIQQTMHVELLVLQVCSRVCSQSDTRQLLWHIEVAMSCTKHIDLNCTGCRAS